jgi:hypothetical protein
MARYGLSYYGIASYGPDNPVSYVSPLEAVSTNYGRITVKWVSPSGTWSKIRLVRNSYGFPVNAWDGDVLVTAYKENDPILYYDSNLKTNAFYYYSIFVYETTQFVWRRAGDAIGLSVKDYGHTKNLYDYLPEITKVTRLYDASSDLNNEDLLKFLSVFGFDLSQTHTLTNLIENRYDIEHVNGVLLPLYLKQFGLDYERELGYQQSRILVRDAIQIGKKKGTADGVREFLKAFTGYGLPQPISGTPNPGVDGLVMGKNLMLDYNDSSFEESIGRWALPTGAAAEISCLKQLSVTKVSVTASVAKLVVGTHSYKANQKIYVFNSPYPALNSVLTPLTISSVDATAIYVPATITTLAESTGYNKTTGSYTYVAPYPNPWNETSSPASYPNRKKGILSLNKITAAGDIVVACGDTASIIHGVPVTSGSQYTFSFYAASQGTSRQVTPAIKWYTRLGVFISESTGTATATPLNTFSTRMSVTATAPSTAAYGVPKITVAAAANGGSEFHFVDCAQFEKDASATTFEESRRLNITLKATRINELVNPHFANPITPWSIDGGTHSFDQLSQEPNADVYSITHYTVAANVVTIETSFSHDYEINDEIVISGLGAPFDGTHLVTGVGTNPANTSQASKTLTFSLTTANVPRTTVSGPQIWLAGDAVKISATSSTVSIKSTTSPSDLMGIYYPSTSYTFSVYAQISTGGSEELVPAITWYDSSKNVISTSLGETFIATATGTTWNQISVTGTAPANAAYAHVSVEWDVIDGNVLTLDAALFENVGFVLPYFDGTHGPAESTDLFWEGTAQASRSHLYKNRFVVQSRITSGLLEDFLPHGSSVAIFFAQPKT